VAVGERERLGVAGGGRRHLRPRDDPAAGGDRGDFEGVAVRVDAEHPLDVCR
jgi:hypothetical protein